MMTAKKYAMALDALFQREPAADLGKKFIARLKETGQIGLLPRIVKECEQLERERKAARTAEVVVVSAHHSLHAREDAKRLIREKGEDPETWTITVVEDPHLIGGHIVRMRETLLDASDRSALFRLYERLKQA